MEFTTITVCVTGAAGNIAYSLIPLIVGGHMFGPKTTIHLRLLDLSVCETLLKGVVMELEDSAYPLLLSTKYGSEPKLLFEACDIVIFLGGAARQPGQERRDLLAVNAKIFKEQGEALNEVAKPSCKCLVVANPCNTNCYILQKNCPNIPKQNFTSLSRLDHNRAVGQVSMKLGVDPFKVKKVTIWGNHSNLQYPDLSFAEVDGKRVKDVYYEIFNQFKLLNEEYIGSFIKTVQNRGAEVLQQRKKSSVFSAAKAILDHMISWMNGTEEGTWISMGIISDGSYGIPEGLVFSCPVVCKNFDYTIVKELPITEASKELLQACIEELVEEREEALDEL